MGRSSDGEYSREEEKPVGQLRCKSICKLKNMFGTKIKLWMENHIARAKRKNHHDKEKPDQNNGVKGYILESSESLAHSDTGISSGSQQVLSSSNTDNNEGYCTATTESSRSGIAHCHGAANLSSPESAYSTGYSTDGTSPGATGPPEYYINIRTGKHYFPSPAPTPTSPQPSTAFSQLCSSGNHCIATSFLTSTPSSIPSYSSQLSSILSNQGGNERIANTQLSSNFSPTLKLFDTKNSILSTSACGHFSKSPKKPPPKSPLNSLKLFLKSPKQDKIKPIIDEKTPPCQNKKASSPVKNKKWYKQPFHKFGHRRTDSTDEAVLKNEIAKKEVNFDRSLYFLPKENTSSPRQRNRIRTNPWLPTEPLSSQNFQINFSPNSVRNRSCTNTPLQNRRIETDVEQSDLKEINATHCKQEHVDRAANRHTGQKLLLELSDHSEEDLTLNEMMGTYNESYVYEKETDILSDSDPTDCEDYVSDSEADNGGDEQDSHDDELDFIDTGSVVEGDSFLKNTGTCVYYDPYSKRNNFLPKTARNNSRNESEIRRSFKKEGEMKKKKPKDEKRKKSFRRSVRNPERSTERPKVEPANMSKLLMRRANGNNGSKSADGTPVCLRRRKLVKELRETHIGEHKTVNADKCSPFPSLRLEDDIEADKKYNELILEAENMVVTMQNSTVIRARSALDDPDAGRGSLNVWNEAENMCSPEHPQIPKKTAATPRKNLGLSLAVNPKTLNFGDKSSLKAKSSAHSPLDPLGPTFKNFTVFKEVETKISSTSSDGSEGNLTEKNSEAGNKNVVPIAFQSVDLGKPLTTYCPQSEPVKRKIYSCSKTYDKLVKRFENETKIIPGGEGGVSDRCEPSDLTAFETNGRGNFFYNPVYSPYSSPNRKSCDRSRVGSLRIRRRLSNDVDIDR